jgi:hypothetical protein
VIADTVKILDQRSIDDTVRMTAYMFRKQQANQPNPSILELYHNGGILISQFTPEVHESSGRTFLWGQLPIHFCRFLNLISILAPPLFRLQTRPLIFHRSMCKAQFWRNCQNLSYQMFFDANES